MPLHIAARVHAFVNGLFRPSDYTQTYELYQKVKGQFDKHKLRAADARENLTAALVEHVLVEFDLPTDHIQRVPITRLVESILEYEGLFLLPRVDWTERHSVTEYWEIRDELNRQRKFVEDFADSGQRIITCVTTCLAPLYAACPQLVLTEEPDSGITFSCRLIDMIGDIGVVTERIMSAVVEDDYEEAPLFARHRERLDYNLIIASGGNPADPKAFNRAPKLPSKADSSNPAELVGTYLGGTPLANLFAQDTTVVMPTRARMEHHWIVSPPGGGKSTMLQYLLMQDFERVARDEASVVVIDSNRDLAKSIEGLKRFAKGGDLEGRLIVIDVEDVEYPVAINIFDTQTDDTDLSARDREVLYNSSVSMLAYIFHALLGAEMTSRQSTLFTFTIELLLALEEPTLDTLIDLMQPDGLVKHAAHTTKLSPDARRFFELKFGDKAYIRTKSEVVDRLFAVKRIRALARIFSSPKTKLNLFDELSKSRVIVINAAKSVLQEDGVEIFTRFFLANILLAAEKRQLLPKAERLDTYLYLDESQDVIRRDERLPVVLDQCRKLNLGCVIANQRLGQMTPPVLNALMGSTAIKFAANLADTNLSAMANSMHTTPEFLRSQPPFHFGAYIRGTTETALSLNVPHVDFSKMEQMTDAEREDVRRVMRKRYATYYTSETPSSEDDRKDEGAGTRTDDTDGGTEPKDEPPDLDHPY